MRKYSFFLNFTSTVLYSLLLAAMPVVAPKDLSEASQDYIAQVAELIKKNTFSQDQFPDDSEESTGARAQQIALAQEIITNLSSEPSADNRRVIANLRKAITVLASVGRTIKDDESLKDARNAATKIITLHNSTDKEPLLGLTADDEGAFRAFPPRGVRVFSVLVSPEGMAQAKLETELSEKKAEQKRLSDEVAVSPRAQNRKDDNLADLTEKIEELEKERQALRQKTNAAKEKLAGLAKQLEIASKKARVTTYDLDETRDSQTLFPVTREELPTISEGNDEEDSSSRSSTKTSVSEEAAESKLTRTTALQNLDAQIQALRRSDRSTLTRSQQRALDDEITRLTDLTQRLQTIPAVEFEAMDPIKQERIERDQKAAIETIEDENAFKVSGAVTNNLRREITADFNAMEFADSSDPEFRKKNEGFRKLFATPNPANSEFNEYYGQQLKYLKDILTTVRDQINPEETLLQFSRRFDGEFDDEYIWYKGKIAQMVESGISIDDLDRVMNASAVTRFLDQQMAKAARLKNPSELDVFKAKITGTGYAQFMRERAQQRELKKQQAAKTEEVSPSDPTKTRLQVARERAFAEISREAIDAEADQKKRANLQLAADRMDTSVFLTKQADVDDFVARTKEVLVEEENGSEVVTENFTDMSDDEFRSKLFPELAAQEAELAKIKAPRVRDAKRLAIMKNSLMEQLKDRESEKLFFSASTKQQYKLTRGIGAAENEETRKRLMAQRSATAATVAAAENVAISEIRARVAAEELSPEEGNAQIADEYLKVRMLQDAKQKALRDKASEFARLRDEFSRLAVNPDQVVDKAATDDGKTDIVSRAAQLQQKMVAELEQLKTSSSDESFEDLQVRAGKLLYLREKANELNENFNLQPMPRPDSAEVAAEFEDLRVNLSEQLAQKFKAQEMAAESEAKELQAVDMLADQYAKASGDTSGKSPLQRAAREYESRKTAIERDHAQRLRALLDAHLIPAASYENMKQLRILNDKLAKLRSEPSTLSISRYIEKTSREIDRLNPAVELLKKQQAAFLEQERAEQLRYKEVLAVEAGTYQSTVDDIKQRTRAQLSEDAVQQQITTSQELEALTALRATATNARVQAALDTQITAKRTRLTEIESQLDEPSALALTDDDVDSEGRVTKKQQLRQEDQTPPEMRRLAGVPAVQQIAGRSYAQVQAASSQRQLEDGVTSVARQRRLTLDSSTPSTAPAARQLQQPPALPPPPAEAAAPIPPLRSSSLGAAKDPREKVISEILERNRKDSENLASQEKLLEEAALAHGDISKKETAKYLKEKLDEYRELTPEQRRQRAVKYATKDQIKGKKGIPDWLARMIKSPRIGRIASDKETSDTNRLRPGWWRRRKPFQGVPPRMGPEELLRMRLRAKARRDISAMAQSDGETLRDELSATKIAEQLFPLRMKSPNLLAAKNRQLQMLLGSDDSSNTTRGGNPALRAQFYQNGKLPQVTSILRDGQRIDPAVTPPAKKSLIQRLTPKRWAKSAQP
jgi:hypothetical protein